jgi:hypothetical protein
MSLDAINQLEQEARAVVDRCVSESRAPSVLEVLRLADAAHAAGMSGVAAFLQQIVRPVTLSR